MSEMSEFETVDELKKRWAREAERDVRALEIRADSLRAEAERLDRMAVRRQRDAQTLGPLPTPPHTKDTP